MKSKKASLLKRLSFLTIILSLALILTWQVSVDAETVTFGDNTGNDFAGTVEDAFIFERSGYEDFNYGGRVNFAVGEPANTARTRRSLIRFKDIFSNIGSGKIITSATMYLYCNSESSTTDYSVSAYRVLKDWVEGTQNGVSESGSSCWNYAQYTSLPWSTTGCGAASDVTGEDSTADRRATAEASTLITSTGQYFAWDLTSAVQNWYSGAWSEYGVILINDSEGIADSNKNFFSSENANDGYRPYLSVTYETPHEIAKPGQPIGPGYGEPGENLTLTRSTPTDCSLEHGTLEYRFDWGDGTPYSSWSTSTSASHSYASSGTYLIKVQARCTTVISEWGTPWPVVISESGPIVRYVDDDGLCGGNSPCYYDIQTAIDASSAGGTVMVYAGTYTENITMKGGVNVVSEGTDTETTYATAGSWEWMVGGSGPLHYLLDNDTTTGNYDGGYYLTFDLGHEASYTITHVRVYGRSTTWHVYVGGSGAVQGTTCNSYFTRVKRDWVLGDTADWYETEVTQLSGTRYIYLNTSYVQADRIFEFQYKAGGDWQTPVTVAAPCTDVGDSYTWVLQRSTETIIDGGGDVGPVVSFDETVMDPTILDGFTIQNIDDTVTTDLPLVRVRGCSPTIKNNIIRYNFGTAHNGGIGIEGRYDAIEILASPLIENNWIHQVNGPGIGNGPYSAATIRNNVIWDCNGDDAPGIGLMEDTWPTIEDNIIVANDRAGIGSKQHGLEAKGSTLTIPPIKGNVIHDNKRGGIHLERATGDTGDINVTIGEIDAINDIYGNTKRSDGMGGGIYLRGVTQATIQYNLIDTNWLYPGMAGGNGIYVADVTTTDIIGNDISEHWVGVHFRGSLDSVTIRGNAIYGNWAGINTRWYYSTTANINTLTVENNKIYSNSCAGVFNSGADSFYAIGNDIYSNGDAGIRIERGVGSITQNNIYSNRTGIAIANEYWSASNPPDYLITKNNIYQNTGGTSNQGAGIGISPQYSNFTPTFAPTLTIRQNKVWGQTNTARGGGIQVVSVYGDITIENNLVFKNKRGGIRFGDSTGVVRNNTVVGNGEADYGGGIIFSSNDPPEPPTGTPPISLVVRNNISTHNERTGIRACGCDRDYNLLYDNWYGYGYGDCSHTAWPGCIKRQLGGCWPKAANEIFADPLYVDISNDDYHLQSTANDYPEDSPAITYPGDDGTQRGCYGGDYPIDW